MGFIKRFFKGVLMTATLLASMTFAGAQTGVAPNVRFLETDQALPDGLWRIRLDGDVFSIQKNTNAANNFATATTAISIAANGDVTIPQDFFVTGSATITVNASITGNLLIDDASWMGWGDTKLFRDEPWALALRDGNNDNTFRIYDQFTDLNNYMRLALYTGSSGNFFIESQTAGTGDSVIHLTVASAGDGTLTLDGADPTVVKLQSGGMHPDSGGPGISDLGRLDNSWKDGFFGQTLFTGLIQTTSIDVIVIDAPNLVAPGQQDSGKFLMTGLAHDGSAHDADWIQFVDVTSDAGLSTYALQTRIDAAGFQTVFSVNNGSADEGGFSFPNSQKNISIGASVDADQAMLVEVEIIGPSSTNKLTGIRLLPFSEGADSDTISVSTVSIEGFVETGTGTVADVAQVVITETFLSVGGTVIDESNLLIDLIGTGGDNTHGIKIRGYNTGLATSAIFIGADPLSGDGTLDSEAIILRGLGFESATPHNVDFKQFVDVIANTGAGSLWTLQTRIDGAGFVDALTVSATEVSLPSASSLDWGGDTKLFRDENAWELGLRDGNNDNTFYIYNQFTDFNNYERLALYAGGGGVVTIEAQTAGTGADQQDMEIWAQGFIDLHPDNNSQPGTFYRFQHGGLQFNPDDTHDLGANASSLRPREGYFSGNLFAGLAHTSPEDALVLDSPNLTGAGQRDSNSILLTGQGHDGSQHDADWKTFVDVTDNSGLSTYALQTRIDAIGFQTVFSVNNGSGDQSGFSFPNTQKNISIGASVDANQAMIVELEIIGPSSTNNLTGIRLQPFSEGADSDTISVSTVSIEGFVETGTGTVADVAQVVITETFLSVGGTVIDESNLLIDLIGTGGDNTHGIKIRGYNTGLATSAIFIGADAISSGQLDSEAIIMRGQGHDGSPHNADWKTFVDVTSNAGASTWRLQNRIDMAGFATKLTVDDGGNLILTEALGPTLLNETSTATNPTLIPDRNDPTTGIGGFDQGAGGQILNLVVQGNNIFSSDTTVATFTVASLTQNGVMKINGVDDNLQFLIEGNATQTNDLLKIRTSASVDLLTFTNAGIMTLGEGLSSPIDALVLDQADRVGDGTTDSHAIILTGVGFESATPHDADWKTFVDVTSNAGASVWTMQERIDAASFVTVMTLNGGSQLSLPQTASFIAIGLTPAQDGDIRLRNGGGIQWRNQAGNDDLAGVFVDSSDILQLAFDSAIATVNVTANLTGADADAYSLLNVAASLTQPTLIPRRSNLTTGIGGNDEEGNGQLNFIVDGVNVFKSTINSAILTLQTGGGFTINANISQQAIQDAAQLSVVGFSTQTGPILQVVSGNGTDSVLLRVDDPTGSNPGMTVGSGVVTPIDMLILEPTASSSSSFKDSHGFLITGKSHDGAPHDIDWRTFVDVTTNAGASTWTLQTRIDAAGYADMLTITDAGVLLADTLTLTTPLAVPQGGTGAATFTDGGLLFGQGAGTFSTLAQATDGQIPMGASSDDPILATITGTANQITNTVGAGSTTLSIPSAFIAPGSVVVTTTSTHTGASDFQSTVTIDVDNAEAFLIRADGDGGDVFDVNTLTGEVTVGTGNSAGSLFEINASFTGNVNGSESEIFSISSALTGNTGMTSSIAGARLFSSITTQAAAEVITDVAQLILVEPNITIVTATVTNAATLMIQGAPTEGVTTNNALFVKSGLTTLAELTVEGDLGVTGASTTALGSTLNIQTATAVLAMTSGSSVTATNLIPAGSFVVGIVTRVNDLVTGPAGYDVGDGVQVDRWGNSILVAADTTSDITDFQSSALTLFPAANDVVITTDGVDFTAGNIRVIVYYMSLTAPTVD